MMNDQEVPIFLKTETYLLERKCGSTSKSSLILMQDDDNWIFYSIGGVVYSINPNNDMELKLNECLNFARLYKLLKRKMCEFKCCSIEEIINLGIGMYK